MNLKKFIILVMMFTLSVLTAVSANSDIKVYVNDKVLECDVAPFIMEGRTMVPMRKIFEALNATVEWDGETKTITATKGDSHIVLQINSSTMINDGAVEELDVAPVIVNDSTFVPIRAVSQSLNASVDWLGYNKTVYINSADTYYTDYLLSMESLPKVMMYAPDGRTVEVLESEATAYQNVGWYAYPVATMYAPDGRTTVIAEWDVEAYQNVGWYLYPVVTMYAPDGRTIDVGEHEVNDYVSVGWYKTYAEAQAVNTPSYSDGHSGYGNSYENSYNSQEDGGSYSDEPQAPVEGQEETVYVGNTGNKYHRQGCRTLKNGALPMSLSAAKAEGREACKICY